MLSGGDKDSHWGEGKEVGGKHESYSQFAKPLAFVTSILKGYSEPQNAVWPLGSCRWKCGAVGLESRLTPPCPLCCCTFTSPLFREGTATPAASQLVMWEETEALGESSDGVHLPEVITWTVQPGGHQWKCQWRHQCRVTPEAERGYRKNNSSCFSCFLSLLCASSALLACSNLHLPFPSCSPV